MSRNKIASTLTITLTKKEKEALEVVKTDLDEKTATKALIKLIHNHPRFIDLSAKYINAMSKIDELEKQINEIEESKELEIKALKKEIKNFFISFENMRKLYQS